MIATFLSRISDKEKGFCHLAVTDGIVGVQKFILIPDPAVVRPLVVSFTAKSLNQKLDLTVNVVVVVLRHRLNILAVLDDANLESV